MMSCSAVIVASGSSRRMGFDKLAAPLAGKPVLLRSIEAFLAAPSVDEVVVVCPADRFVALGLTAAPAAKLLRRVDGGAERRDSVACGLAAVRPEASLVAVHDGARPLVAVAAIERCIATARDGGAAALARPLTETVVRAGPDGLARETVDRTGLWIMETPQVFRTELLRAACAAVRERGEPVTDEVSAVALLGVASRLVESPAPNPKITLPGDIAAAERLLAATAA
jgi:2-C-methyl-D-erythritol 4-phosphate cytidylyltransferase